MSAPIRKTYLVIRPDSRYGEGFFAACIHLFKEIFAFRDQIWIVYQQSFRQVYHAAGFGRLWNFVLPLVPLTVYLFLAQIRVFPSFHGVDGSTFLTFGVTIWYVLTGFVQIPIRVIQSRNDEAMKTSLPISVSIVSGFAELAFETLVRSAFVLLVMMTLQSWPVWSAPVVLLVLVPGVLLFLGAGLVLGTMNVIYRDVSRVVGILLQYGIFVSGVIFPLGQSTAAVVASMLNPFSFFIDASRTLVFEGLAVAPVPLIAWSAVSIFMFLVGARLFYVMEYRIRGIN